MTNNGRPAKIARRYRINTAAAAATRQGPVPVQKRTTNRKYPEVKAPGKNKNINVVPPPGLKAGETAYEKLFTQYRRNSNSNSNSNGSNSSNSNSNNELPPGVVPPAPIPFGMILQPKRNDPGIVQADIRAITAALNALKINSYKGVLYYESTPRELNKITNEKNNVKAIINTMNKTAPPVSEAVVAPPVSEAVVAPPANRANGSTYLFEKKIPVIKKVSKNTKGSGANSTPTVEDFPGESKIRVLIGEKPTASTIDWRTDDTKKYVRSENMKTRANLKYYDGKVAFYVTQPILDFILRVRQVSMAIEYSGFINYDVNHQVACKENSSSISGFPGGAMGCELLPYAMPNYITFHSHPWHSDSPLLFENGTIKQNIHTFPSKQDFVAYRFISWYGGKCKLNLIIDLNGMWVIDNVTPIQTSGTGTALMPGANRGIDFIYNDFVNQLNISSLINKFVVKSGWYIECDTNTYAISVNEYFSRPPVIQTLGCNVRFYPYSYLQDEIGKSPNRVSGLPSNPISIFNV